MILSLRKRHRRIFAVIGVVLPIAFAVGIAARRPVPTVNSVPTELVDSSREFTALEWKRADLFAKSPVEVRLLRERAGGGALAVSFFAPANFAKPDLLVYWVGGKAVAADSVPEDAVLLGAFGPAALPLPAEASKHNGMLILYSLADNEIVDVSRALPF